MSNFATARNLVTSKIVEYIFVKEIFENRPAEFRGEPGLLDVRRGGV
jgi:hypothetical protein